MYDDDRDALAAEYVLGTLSAEEREQAEALLVIDPGFAETVRVWERRLGELNVMVEAVEPPPEVWDKIAADINGAAPRAYGDVSGYRSAQSELETASPSYQETASLTASGAAAEFAADLPATEPSPEFTLTPEPAAEYAPESDAPSEPQDLDGLASAQDLAAVGQEETAALPQDFDAVASAEHLETEQVPQDLEVAEPLREADEQAAVAALASSLLPPEPAPELPLPPELGSGLIPPPAVRSAEIISLQRRVRRWRGVTVVMGALAALLALYIGVGQFAPGLVALGHRPQPVIAAAPPPGARLVAVLQQEPTAPAFLLTLDVQNRTYTVRTVSATPTAGRSYELWLISSKYPSPRSLGLVGGEAFTSRPLPAGFDLDTMRGANYAVSLEPAGGSPSGVPTGPVLFTGKMVESLPGSPAPG